MVDADSAPVALRFAIEPQGEIVWQTDPITLMKAGKNRLSLPDTVNAITRMARRG
jgi:Xaa-Pro aminopeptidase